MTDDLQLTVQITPEMIAFTDRANALGRALEAAGVPYVSLLRDRIEFPPETSQEQQDVGDAILAAWDWDAPPVPAQMTATQAKLALIDAGLYEAVDFWITGAETESGGFRYRVVWDAANWYRTSRELNEIAGEIGLTDAQVDDLFRLAATK